VLQAITRAIFFGGFFPLGKGRALSKSGQSLTSWCASKSLLVIASKPAEIFWASVVPLRHIQSISGHHTLAALERYLGVTDQQKQSVIATLKIWHTNFYK
jgi:hypothetical protein